MGQTQPKPVRVCKDVLWSQPTSRTHYPTAEEIEQCLLSTDCTARLGKDVCRIISAYCPCVLDSAFVTSHGHIVPVAPSTSPTAATASSHSFTAPFSAAGFPQQFIRVRPRLPCQATCFTPLPPSCMAFGLADVAPLNPGESRRAKVAIYNAHSFTHLYNVHFPQQSSFLTPVPSVSSLLLLPKADASPASYSSLLAGIDDLGHLCVWRWTTGELLFLFNTKPPVFFSLSSLCALPNARLALLLSGCPGPQHPASRVLVFDLSTGAAYKSAVDSDNQSDQIFPLSLYFPPQPAPTPASPALSPTRARCNPYSLYSNDALYRWHVNSASHTVELHNATPPPSAAAYTQPHGRAPWQGMGQSSQYRYGFGWRHRAECVRAARGGVVVRVEGGVGVVKVWIGHHVERRYQGQWEFEDKGYEEEVEDVAEKKSSDSEEEETESEEEEAKRPPQTHSLSSTTSIAASPLDDDRKAAAALDSTDDDEPATTSASTTTSASPLSTVSRTAPVLIPRVVPLPLLLPAPLLFRRRHRHRRRPALLQVSAAFVQPPCATAAPLLVVTSSAPTLAGRAGVGGGGAGSNDGSGGGGGGGRLVTVWRLVGGSGGEGVSGECLERRRYHDVGGEDWSVLCGDAAAKVAQRMKGPKQWLIG